MKSKVTGKVSLTIDASVSKVWDALTNPEIIKQYFFGTNAKSDWKVGSPITFSGEWKGKSYQDKGTIIDIEKNRLLSYTYWSSMSGTEDIPSNYVIVTYKLSQQDGKTNLTIIQENIPDEKMKRHSEENWGKVMKGLKDVVEGKVIAS